MGILSKIALAAGVMICATVAPALTIAEREPNDYEEYVDRLGLRLSKWMPQDLGVVSGEIVVNGAIGTEQSETTWGDVFKFKPAVSGNGSVRIEGACALTYYDCCYFGTAGCAFGYALTTTRYISRVQVGSSDIAVNFVAGCDYFLHVKSTSQASYAIKLSMPQAEKEKVYSIALAPGSFGVGTASSVEKKSGEVFTLPGATFSRTGYEQTGWSKKSDGSSKAYGLKESFAVTESLTLYPYWTKNQDFVKLSSYSDTGHDYRAFEGSFTVSASGSWSVAKSVSESWVRLWTSGNAVCYSFEQNNTAKERACVFTVTCGNASETFRAYQSGRKVADLVITQVSVENADGNEIDVAAGRYRFLVAVKNQGTSTSPQTTVRVSSLDVKTGSVGADNTIETMQVPSLKSGQSVTVSGQWFAGSSLGVAGSSRSYGFMVDPSYLIDEVEEDNNGADLVVQIVDSRLYTVVFSNGAYSKSWNYEWRYGEVYKLPEALYWEAQRRFAGWRCSNGKRYDDGALVFNLAQPGETVTMTAIWE